MNVSRILAVLGLCFVWFIVGVVGGLYAGYLAWDYFQQDLLWAGFCCGATATFVAVGVGEFLVRLDNFVRYGKFRNPCLVPSYLDQYQ